MIVEKWNRNFTVSKQKSRWNFSETFTKPQNASYLIGLNDDAEEHINVLSKWMNEWMNQANKRWIDRVKRKLLNWIVLYFTANE